MSDHLKQLVLPSEVQKCLSQNSPSKAKQLQCRTEGSDRGQRTTIQTDSYARAGKISGTAI